MSPSERHEMSQQAEAEQLAQRVGSGGEHGIDVAEGMDSGKSSTLDSTLGDVVPGFSSLLKKHKRVVLVTDRHVYLLAGTIKKPGDTLSVFDLGPDVMRLENDMLTLPDGHTVRVTRFQAQRLLQAAGGSFSKEFARRVLRNAGKDSESVVAFAWGTNAIATKRGAVDRASEALFIGGGQKMEHEGRFVLVTNASCYIARDGSPDIAGTVVGTYPLGIELEVSDEATVAFPDGQTVKLTVKLKNDGQAHQLVQLVAAP
jgi:hypothetical protein